MCKKIIHKNCGSLLNVFLNLIIIQLPLSVAKHAQSRMSNARKFPPKISSRIEDQKQVKRIKDCRILKIRLIHLYIVRPISTPSNKFKKYSIHISFFLEFSQYFKQETTSVAYQLQFWILIENIAQIKTIKLCQPIDMTCWPLS